MRSLFLKKDQILSFLVHLRVNVCGLADCLWREGLANKTKAKRNNNHGCVLYDPSETMFIINVENFYSTRRHSID